MKRRMVLGVALVTLTGGMGGYLLGATGEFRQSDSPASDVVHVHVEIRGGEVEFVSLTDPDGLDMPVGSISESYSDD